MIDYSEIADRFEKRVNEHKKELDRRISEEMGFSSVCRKKIEEGSVPLGSSLHLNLLKKEAESSLHLSRLMREQSLLEKFSSQALRWLRGVDFPEEWEGKDDLRVLCGLSNLVEDGLLELDSDHSSWHALRTVMSLLNYEFLRGV